MVVCITAIFMRKLKEQLQECGKKRVRKQANKAFKCLWLRKQAAKCRKARKKEDKKASKQAKYMHASYKGNKKTSKPTATMYVTNKATNQISKLQKRMHLKKQVYTTKKAARNTQECLELTKEESRMWKSWKWLFLGTTQVRFAHTFKQRRFERIMGSLSTQVKKLQNLFSRENLL